jgi:hypothetical protein
MVVAFVPSVSGICVPELSSKILWGMHTELEQVKFNLNLKYFGSQILGQD